ncbi:acyltransferase 3 [Desulfovibrio sp. X2]|uniref:acyltransferase family protein n=1 Tax=Desulfovibrio sp. X2 TaxID=941449 RepID=UPI00035878A3|nr:acyltransferase family protein [Desulfovibrio sp. X2]EPR37232.1 acyltransferase 3 [Desulfovibrio sp. X2]
MQRDTAIDCARGIGILLVVAGHARGPWPLEKAIYSFHMPLFFLVSGFLAKRTGLGGLVRAKAKTLLVPYLTACLLTFLAFGNGLAASAADLRELALGIATGGANGTLPFDSPLWFLPCLFCVFVLHHALARLVKRPDAALAASFAPALALAALPSFPALSVLRLDTAAYCLPFFCLGALVRHAEQGQSGGALPLLGSLRGPRVLLAALCLWLLARVLDHNAYYVIAQNRFAPLAGFYLNGLAGSLMAFAFAGTLTSLAGAAVPGALLSGLLALSGPSFGIYLLHKPFVLLADSLLRGVVGSDLAIWILNMACGIAASLVCVRLLCRFAPLLGGLLLGDRTPGRRAAQATAQ